MRNPERYIFKKYIVSARFNNEKNSAILKMVNGDVEHFEFEAERDLREFKGMLINDNFNYVEY